MRTFSRLLGALALTCGAVSAQCDLTTLFATNNGGAVGGAVYFDMNVTGGIRVTGLDVNTSQPVGTAIGLTMYTIPGGTAGNMGSIAGWTQVGIDDGTATAQGVNVPSPITFQTPAVITPGLYGVALVASGNGGSFNHSYSNGAGGAPQTFSNALYSITLGNADNTPFVGGGFFPRVWNGTIKCQPANGIFASFTATPSSGPSPLAVSFTDTSFTSDPGGITSWTWDFGDGSPTSNLQNPTHTYASCGNYTATLTVTDTLNGSSTATAPISVDPITADFTSNVNGGAPPLMVSFTDLSVGGATSWLWDFGDGNSSTAQNPTHTYTTGGLFTVSLTVSNGCNTDVETKVDFIGVVANDDCSGAIAVADGANGPFSNVGATTDPLYPWPCALGGSDVYFTYTASCNGVVTVDTCGAGYDTALEIFDGSGGCANLLSLVCNDDACGLQSSATVASVSAGAVLIIRVGGFNGAQGTFPLNISCSGPTGNDECAQAVALTEGLNGPFNTLTATTSAPAWPCALGGNDVWFSYTTNCPGTYEFNLCTGATYDTALELFDGTNGCGNLAPIACNDDFCGLQSGLQAALTAGTTYYLRVGGFNGAQGSFNIDVFRAGGTGTTAVSIPGCGGLTIDVSGDANIGSTIGYALSGSGVQGSPLMWLGVQSLGVPICTGCNLGTEFTVLFTQGAISGQLPCQMSLVGAQYYTQGADIGSLAPGGCPAGIPFPFSLTLSDTIVTTVGM